jgi:hypothetical protein
MQIDVPVRQEPGRPTIESAKDDTVSTCPNCDAEVEPRMAFCESCGERLQEGARRRRGASTLGRHAKQAHTKNIHSARKWILIVGILYFVLAVLFWWSSSIEISKLERSGLFAPEQLQEVSQRVQIIVLVIAGIGGIYMGLCFWAGSNPVGACITALALFGTHMLLTVVVNPGSLLSPLFIIFNVAILSALWFGVRSALAFRRAMAGGGAEPPTRRRATGRGRSGRGSRGRRR